VNFVNRVTDKRRETATYSTFFRIGSHTLLSVPQKNRHDLHADQEKHTHYHGYYSKHETPFMFLHLLLCVQLHSSHSTEQQKLPPAKGHLVKSGSATGV
jgi:uncharacterized protein YpbB